MDNSEMLEKIQLRLDYQDKALARIEYQTNDTSKGVEDISKWRERVKGGFWALSIMTVVLVIPLLTWAFITISKIPERIDQGIRTALSGYNIDVK